MADIKISQLTARASPLTGTELLEVAFSGASYSVMLSQIALQWNPMTTAGDTLYYTGSAMARLAIGAAGTIPVSSGTAPAWLAMSGDATIDATGKVTVHSTNGSAFAASAFTDTTNATNITTGQLPAAVIPATGVAAGTYGDATHVAQFTLGLDGRITGVTSVAIGGGVATVSSVGLAMPADFAVADSPVTTAGVLTVTRANQSPNTFLAGPTAIPVGPPSYRAIAVADLPTGIPVANLTGLAAVATAGTFASLTGTPTTLAGYGIADAVAAAQIGAANGVAGLDATGHVPSAQLPASVVGALEYQGTWDANANAPAIATGSASATNKGWYYRVSVAGATVVDGNGGWHVGDWIVSNGATWDKIDNYESVVSVAGRTGAVTLAYADIAGLGTAAQQTAAFFAQIAAANQFANQQAVTPYRASVSGAVSIDLAATAKSNVLILTLTGNVTSFALTNPMDGARYRIRFIQDATGTRTLAGLAAAFKFAGGTKPTLSTAANAVDYMTADYGATEASYMCDFRAGMA